MFGREAEVDARHIRVGATDYTAKLYGQVHALRLGKCRERRPPGQASLASVKTHLLISPRPWPTTAKNWWRPARRGPAFVIHFGKLYKLWAGMEKIVIAESNSSTVSSGPARV